jgi:hypothetical protein
MQPIKGTSSQRKGRMQLSISQEVLDRIEPLREEVNFSAEAEQLFSAIATRVERQKWVQCRRAFKTTQVCALNFTQGL